MSRVGQVLCSVVAWPSVSLLANLPVWPTWLMRGPGKNECNVASCRAAKRAKSVRKPTTAERAVGFGLGAAASRNQFLAVFLSPCLCFIISSAFAGFRLKSGLGCDIRVLRNFVRWSSVVMETSDTAMD
jgi:hypothetical protein